MAGNSNLHDSIRNKQDEFYTQIGMIEDELKNYRDFFRGKVVYCNCDDPQESHFWKYFAINFEFLGLKKLIATHYDREKPTYMLELSKDITGDGQINEKDIVEKPFSQNGDFRSPECVELLKLADVVVTNPPFSLFTEYMNQLIKYKKKFLIIGNLNNSCYKDIIPHIVNGDIWLGKTAGHFWFRVPDYYEVKKTDFKIDENGKKWRRMGNICWYTNIDYKSRHEDVILYKHYDPQVYPKYDDLDAIDVKFFKDIPCDYYGIMGVPISGLNKISPDQFEILGKIDSGEIDKYNLGHPDINGRHGYKRIAIRRKTNEN